MPQNRTATATVDDWAAVPTAAAGDGADDWGPVPDASASEQPKKQGFKQSLRAGMGLKPEGGFWDDISQIGTGFKQMASHPVDSLSDLISGAYQGQEDVAEKGVARMKGDRLIDKISGGAQYLESGIPFAGPVLSRAGEQAEEGDYSGMAGTMLPLVAGMDTKPLRGAVGDVMRTPGGEVRPLVRDVGRGAGGLAGMTALPEHPYVGAGIGYGAGARLTDLITPKRTPDKFSRTKYTPWEGPGVPDAETSGQGTLPLAEEFYEQQGTKLMKRGKEQEALDRKARLSERMTSSGGRPGEVTVLPEGQDKPYDLTPEQVPGRPQLRRLAQAGDPRAGKELTRRGEQVIYKSVEGDYPPPRSRSRYTTSAPEEEAAPASPVSKSSKAEGSSAGAGAEKRASARPKGTTLSDKMAKQFALEESIVDTTKRLKAEKDPAVKRHMQQQIDDFNRELKGLQ